MRNKILAVMLLGLFATTFSVIGVLAYFQHKATERRFHEQQSTLVRFAVVNVEMGISTGQINSLKKFLNRLQQYPIFVGAIVYDTEMTPIVTIPKDFNPLTSEDEILGTLTHGEISYEMANLKDLDGEEIGKFLIALTFAPMKAEARRAVLYTGAFGLFILLPVLGIIAWRLRWYEKSLKENENHLIEKNKTLEETRIRLDETKNEIQHMLNNLDEGIFTINPDCSVNAQHSLRARALFGMHDFQGANLAEIFEADEDGIKVFKKWVDLVTEPRFLEKWKLCEKLNPFREINKKSNGAEQVIKVDYTPIIENDSVAKIMVLATDITEKIKAKKELDRSRREQKALMERVLAFVSNDKTAVDTFMNDMERYLKGFSEIKSSEDLSVNVPQLYRDMHTIKGDAGTFGFGRLAKLAGNLEELFVRLKAENKPSLYQQWCGGFEEFTTEFMIITDFRKRIFSEDKEDRMSISRTEYDRLIKGINSRQISDINEIFAYLYDLDSQPFESYCKKYQKIIQIYTEKYDKEIDDLKIENPQQMVHRDVMAALDPSVIHTIRNAVDHGIESDEERENADKGPGLVTISLKSEKTESTLKISDNGKGIDPEMIAKLAVERNFITEEDVAKLSAEEKINLIFNSGFTTKKEATETSGRGVGADAVKTYMEKLHGSVTIDTKVGNGTTIVLKLPIERSLETKSE